MRLPYRGRNADPTDAEAEADANGQEAGGAGHQHAALSLENLERLDASHGDEVEGAGAECIGRDCARATVGGPGREDEDKEEADSLTSHVGSDPGERRVRLDELRAMEVLAEEEDDDEDKEEDGSVSREPSERGGSAEAADNEKLAVPALAARESSPTPLPFADRRRP